MYGANVIEYRPVRVGRPGRNDLQVSSRSIIAARRRGACFVAIAAQTIAAGPPLYDHGRPPDARPSTHHVANEFRRGAPFRVFTTIEHGISIIRVCASFGGINNGKAVTS